MDAPTHNMRSSFTTNNNQEVQTPPLNYTTAATTATTAAGNMDPKRLRRLQMRREYAQRFRLKKQEYLQDLLVASNAEEGRIAMLSPQVSFFQSQIEMLERENAALRQQIQEMEAQASIADGETKQLKSESETLKSLMMQQMGHM